MFNFIINRKINCFLINVGITILTYCIIKKNLGIAMLLGLIMSNFIFTCSKIIEGADDESVEEVSEEVEEEEVEAEEDEAEEEEEVESEKLAKAIQNAKNTGLINTSDSVKNVAEKQKKKLQRQVQRCAAASLRPINECIADRNRKIDGTDDINDDDDNDNDEY
jgi:dsDNA-specific endonuclease/ATPase MutS2